MFVFRRLYPDMAFFQRPTDYPCQLILDPQNDYETLRRRVEQTTLKAQTVNRNRSGVTNVRDCFTVCKACAVLVDHFAFQYQGEVISYSLFVCVPLSLPPQTGGGGRFWIWQVYDLKSENKVFTACIRVSK